MPYVDGLLIPVPAKNKDAYAEMARKYSKLWLDNGATRIVECWGDDIKAGKINDFRTAVIAEADENVVFSWIEWPDKATRDAGMEKILADPAMQHSPEKIFDGARMIFAGFTSILDTKEQ